MKASSLILSALLALSVGGAAADNVAPATIELVHCDAAIAAPCDIPVAVPADAGETDLHAVPADPKRRPNPDEVTPVPEPHTFVMLMLGLVVLGFASRRKESSEKFKD